MPVDKETKHHIGTNRAAASRDGPLTPAEQAVLDRLLERKAESQPAALARLERERAEREALEKKRNKLAAQEEKLAAQLRGLQADIDRCTDQLGERLSVTARRQVVGTMERFYDLQAKFISAGMPPPGRAAVAAFADLVATPHERRDVVPLRQRLSTEEPPGKSNGLTVEEMADDSKIIAAAILAAGRRRRNESS